MGDLLDAWIGSLSRHAMPRGVDVTRGAGQAVGPPDRGGIEDDVVLGAIVERRRVLGTLAGGNRPYWLFVSMKFAG